MSDIDTWRDILEEEACDHALGPDRCCWHARPAMGGGTSIDVDRAFDEHFLHRLFRLNEASRICVRALRLKKYLLKMLTDAIDKFVTSIDSQDILKVCPVVPMVTVDEDLRQELMTGLVNRG